MRKWLRWTDKPAMTAVEKFTLEDDWLLHRERAVAWLRVGFAVVGVIVIQLNPERVARFQAALVSRFPNVSVIDFHEILETVRDVMGKVTLAITVVGGLVLFSGALILVGAVAMTKFQRVYEAAVFKTLGANTRAIARMLLYEYGVLGSLAGLIGSAGAVVLTWTVSRYALDIPWKLFPGEHIAGVLLTAALVAGIGVLSSLDVLRNKPLATLRAE